jgi:hypothetical protein
MGTSSELQVSAFSRQGCAQPCLQPTGAPRAMLGWDSYVLYWKKLTEESSDHPLRDVALKGVVHAWPIFLD